MCLSFHDKDRNLWEMLQEILKPACGEIKKRKLIGLQSADKGEKSLITYSKVLIFI